MLTSFLDSWYIIPQLELSPVCKAWVQDQGLVVHPNYILVQLSLSTWATWGLFSNQNKEGGKKFKLWPLKYQLKLI